MSSDSMGKCSLCFRQILVKNFKRHCERQYNTIDTEEKYKKQLVKLKKSITNNNHSSPSKSKIVENQQLHQQPENENSLFSSSIKHSQEQSTTNVSDVCSIITDPVTTTSSSISFVIDEPVQSSSISTKDNDEINAIKSNICGGIKHLIDQTNQGSDFADLSVNPNLSEKCFILQLSSYLKMIQELVTDLINDCDHALQGMPTLVTTIDKIHLSEIITNRDPSF